MNFIKTAAYVLVVIGALNWGLVGLFNFDLVAFFFGDLSKVTRIIYILVGISALISTWFGFTCCISEKEECNNQ